MRSARPESANPADRKYSEEVMMKAIVIAALVALAGVALLVASLGSARAKQDDLRVEEVAARLVESYNAHNVRRLMDLYSDEVTVVTPDLTVVKGKPENQRYYEAWFKSVPDVKSIIKSVTVEDNRFVLELVETGTYRVALPSAGAPPASGQKLRYPYVMIGGVREGKITSLRIYENDLLVEKQLGIRK